MDNTQLVIVIVGWLAALLLLVLAYAVRRGYAIAEIAMEVARPALEAVRERGEAIVVESGPDLSVLHSFLLMLEPQTKPDSAMIKKLAALFGVTSDEVASLAKSIWAEFEDWTDGELETAPVAK